MSGGLASSVEVSTYYSSGCACEHLERIDDAYKTKYKGSAYLPATIAERARSATVNIVPHNWR